MYHWIGLFNTFVTRCYLMIPESISIVKFNTRLQKSKKKITWVLINSDSRVATRLEKSWKPGKIRKFTKFYGKPGNTREFQKCWSKLGKTPGIVNSIIFLESNFMKQTAFWKDSEILLCGISYSCQTILAMIFFLDL